VVARFIHSTRSPAGRRVLLRAALLAAVLASVLAATSLPAEAGAARDVSVSTLRHANAAVSGPLDGAKGEFFIAFEAFAFRVDGKPGTHVVADAFFGNVECLTDEAAAKVSIARSLRTATLKGAVTGSCFDLAQQKPSPYRATFEVTVKGTGRLDEQTFVTHDDGQTCISKLHSRDAGASGSLSWSAPQLGIGGTGAPFGVAGLTETRDRCRTAATSSGSR
jgi:hypothetical protein